MGLDGTSGGRYNRCIGEPEALPGARRKGSSRPRLRAGGGRKLAWLFGRRVKREEGGMRPGRLRVAVAIGAALSVIAGAVAVGVALRSGERAQEVGAAEGMPPALAQHVEKLKEAIPGNGGESEEGPGSADA